MTHTIEPTGAALRAAREAAGLTRPALAALCSLHPQSVAYWERKTALDPKGHAVRLMLAVLEAQFPSGPSRGKR